MATPRLDRLEKNLLINSALDFFQRGAVAAPGPIGTSPGWSGPDRWLISYTGTVTGTQTIQRVATNANNFLTTNAAQFAIRRNASIASTFMQQRVESVNARDIAYRGTGAFSVRVNVPISGCQVRLTINTPTVVDNYTAVVQAYQAISAQVIAASTWTTITFPNIAIANAANGLAVIVEIMIPTGTDGAGLNYLLTQAMLVSGPYVQDYSPMGRSFTEEFMNCSRYFEKSYANDTAPGTATGVNINESPMYANVYGSGQRMATVRYRVPKRAAPTVTSYSQAGTINKMSDNSGGDLGDTFTSQEAGDQSFTGASSGGATTTGNIVRFHWTADAEI